MEGMNLNVECYSGRKADERPIRFRLEGRQYLVEAVPDSGTTLRASFISFAAMTGTSIFFDNKHRRPMGRGIWFPFGKRERSADTSEGQFACSRNVSTTPVRAAYSTGTFVPF